MLPTYEEFIAKAHTEFLGTVANLVLQDVRELTPSDREMPVDITIERSLLRFRGLDAEGKSLGITVQLIPVSEFSISAQFLGHQGDSPSVKDIEDIRQWKTEKLKPEELAAILLTYFKGNS